ncbi:MAG: ABC transporter permease subunit [Gammaproteobacteria bacterium]|nr:MAG: ABC transporter permease subunit [Gammaproteobacteria bacterium]
MKNHNQVWGLHAQPSKKTNIILLLMPFVLLLAVYLTASHLRQQENQHDKLLPSATQIVDAVDRVAFTEDRRTGKFLLWSDTLSSLIRLVIGMAAAALVGLLLGLNMGVYPGFRSLSLSFITFFSMIPPLAILPIIFISFGVDEFAKIMLIFIGIFPMISRDIYLAVRKLPREQITKALTLGASSFAVTYRIILPQILPRLIDAIRLSLGAAWLFLIASEAIAAMDGLGYRIFLVRRYLAMDVIIPYVLWITLLGFLFDLILRTIINKRFTWYADNK